MNKCVVFGGLARCRAAGFGLLDEKIVTTVILWSCLLNVVAAQHTYVKNMRFDTKSFEKESPHSLTMVNTSYRFIQIAWEAPNGNATVHNYLVKYHVSSDSNVEYAKRVTADTFTCYLKGLEPGTRYSIYVVANQSGTLENSHTKTQMTLGYGRDYPCLCDRVGSSSEACDPSTGQCECNTKQTTGRQCDGCYARYFKHPAVGCQKCNCPDKVSNGSCSINENGIVMCHCRDGHGGPQCKVCDNGFYMIKGKCAPCKCNDNVNMSSAEICLQDTGVCQACIFSTTGPHCQSCLPGYVGDALSHNCTRIDSGVSHHALIVIISVCFVVLCVVVVLITVYTFLRWRRNPEKNFNFWSVQLRDDRENIHFSPVMDHSGTNAVDASLLSNDEVQFAAQQKPSLSFQKI